jgi:hypothetical protein
MLMVMSLRGNMTIPFLNTQFNCQNA